MCKMTKADMANNAELMKAMNIVVGYLNDERAYESWILTVPDGADDDDFDGIAEDPELVDHICMRFRQVVGAYGEDGWFTVAPFAIGEEHGPLICYGSD